MEVRVLTFNIHHGRGTDKKMDLKRISHIIEESNADVIGLNEVDKEFARRSEFMDQAEQIASDLNMEFIFGPAITISGKGEKDVRQYGSAILTRFPIVKSENHPFDFLPRIVEDRALLEVILKLNNHNIAVYVTHLSLAPFLHGKQTEFILKRIQDQKHPSIVLGDWNMKPYSSSWRLVTDQLKDTWVDHHEKEERGFTYPSDRPRMKLDYIFTTNEFKVVNTKVFMKDAKASDHLPLFATLKMNERTEGEDKMACNIDHSVEDVEKKLEDQEHHLPEELYISSRGFLMVDPTQEELNELFHLLKKYDLASKEEKQKRNHKINDLLNTMNDAR